MPRQQQAAASIAQDNPATRSDIRRLEDRIAALHETVNRPPPRWLSPAHFGEMIGVSDRKVRRLLDAGMPFIRVGVQPRIEPDAALEWLRAQSGQTSAP